MLLYKLIHFIKGYLILEISGRFPERFLNMCLARKILIWDVKRLSETTVRLKISIRGFKILKHISVRTGTKIKIIEKRGLPMIIKKHKRRKPLFIGIVLFLILLIYMNQYIWDIEINGCEKISKDTILNTLKECGVYPGQIRFRLDQKKLKNEMLVKIPDLAWLWVEKSGSKIIVEVKEKLPVPEVFKPDDYCSIIALKDGVIDSMIVKNGMPLAELGETVHKNSILVSGMITSERGIPARYLHSEAEIYARTWYEKTKAFSCIVQKREETGKTSKKIRIKLFGLDINFYKNPTPDFTDYYTEEEKYELSLFGKYMGVTLYTNTHHEVSISYTRLAQDDVIADGILEINKLIDELTLPDSKLIKSTPEYKIIDEDTIEITVVSEYIENIAKKVKMEKPEEEILPQAN